MRLGYGLGLEVPKAAASGGGGFAVTATFFCMAFDKKVWKVTPAGVATVFKDYAAASREPYGVAVDSVNGRLFVMCGDTAGQYQIDRFDDLSVDTGATAAASVTAHTQWGGKAFYYSVEDKVYFSTVNGSPSGFHSVTGDLATVANLYGTNGLEDSMYWPPDDEVYGLETASTDELYTGELDGTGWADSLSNFSGTVNSICIPPAHLTGASKYMFVTERLSGRIDRYDRPSGSNRLTWLDLTAASSTLKLFPTAIRVDFANNRLVFAAHANGGTGVDGIYTVPIQEGAQSEGNVTLLAELTLTGNQTSGQGIGVHYGANPETYWVDA